MRIILIVSNTMNLPIFVINLPKDTDRAKHIRWQFSDSWLLYEFIPGFNGKTPNATEQKVIASRYNEEHAKKMNTNPFTRWEIGCALSHISLYEKIVREWIEKALILEDDAIFDSRLQYCLDNIDTIMKQKNWEYLSLNYELMDTSVFYRHEKIHLEKDPKYIFPFFPRMIAAILLSAWERLQQKNPRIRPVHFFRPLYLAWAYIITLEWAKKLLSLSTPYISYPADRLPNQARVQKWLKFFAIAPLLVWQNKWFTSNIEEKK